MVITVQLSENVIVTMVDNITIHDRLRNGHNLYLYIGSCIKCIKNITYTLRIFLYRV